MGGDGGGELSGLELLGLGLYLAASVVVPLLLGAWLDSALHSAPAGILGGLLLGIVAAAGGVYRRFTRYR